MIRHAPSIGLGIGLSLRGSGARFSGILDQYAGASAAYSLRALSSAWLAGDVVEVRRSSDSTTQSFTASQIDSGAMLDFVKKPGAFTNSGFETFANNGTGDGFTATNTTSTGFASSGSVSGIATDVVTIDFDLTIVSGSPSISLRSGITGVSNLETYATSGSKTAVLTATGNFNNFTFSEGDIPSEFTVSNVRVSTNDGFVSTWYDQSGNGNDATQATTTAQPKIVSAGALVTGGLDFDGVDDWMSGTGVTGDISVFATCKQNAQGADFSGIVGVWDGLLNQRSWLLSDDEITSCAFLGSTAGTATSASVNGAGIITSQSLLSAITSSSVFELWRNGASEGTSTGITTFSSSAALTIGAYNAGQASTAFTGTIAEIIVYNSDQSANRAGIETNINDHYSIY